jgi:hypothetical protein
LSQLVRLVSTGTHLQQFGALRDGVCPSAQAAQRTVEQSIFAASVAVPIDPDDVPDEPPMVDESPVVVVVAVPLDPLIVPSVPVCPVPVPVQAASARRAAIHIADSVRIHDLFMRPPLSLPRSCSKPLDPEIVVRAGGTLQPGRQARRLPGRLPGEAGPV